MADPLSVSASAAGLVSLGLQVCTGITQYLDAIKCRDEELGSARRYVQALQSLVQTINGFSSRLGIRHPQSLAAVGPSLQFCQDELKILEALIVELSNGNVFNDSFIDRVRDQKKKLTYPFNRTKLTQLEDKLNRAVGVVQVAVQSLGM
jgi:hypothetical protein